MNKAARTKTQSRWQLVGLATLFFGPLALAFLLYYGLPGIRPTATANHGELLSPARPLPRLMLKDSLDRNVPDDVFINHWSLVWLGPGQCDASCQDGLKTTAVVRQLLGKDASRIQRVFLYSGTPPDSALITAQTSALLVIHADDNDAKALLDQFPKDAAGHIYIIDPHGNLMMRYPSGTDIRQGFLDDMKRLLKYSHIG